jgi:hypothetical protein
MRDMQITAEVIAQPVAMEIILLSHIDILLLIFYLHSINPHIKTMSRIQNMSRVIQLYKYVESNKTDSKSST